MGWDTTSIVYITFEAVTGFITILGNAVVLVTIVRTRQLHTVTNVFIGNLAGADIFVGLFVAPLAALSFLGLPKNVYGCIFINCAILMFTNLSILMLLGVAVERFIAIRLPFVYNRILTIRRAMWLNGGIWILGSLLGLIPMYGWNIAPDNLTSCSFTGVISMEYMIYFQFFGLVVLPIVIMLAIYTYILCVIRKHAKRTDALHKMFSEHRRSGTQWKKEVRAAKSFALLIVLFAVFWLPVYIMNCFTLFCPSCHQPYELLLTAIVMSHANSSINPFLYAASNSRIQKSIKALFSTNRGLEDSSVEIQSGKHNSGIRAGNSLARHKSLSVIAINGTEAIPNTLRVPPSSDLHRKSTNENDNSNPPEIRQLSPLSLASSNGSGSQAYRHNNDMHVSDNSSDAHSVEATRFASESGSDHPEDMHPFSDVVLGDPNKYDDYSEEHVLQNDQVTVFQNDMSGPSKSPKSFSGHINFGYVGDKSNGSISSFKSSPVSNFYTGIHGEETESFTAVTSRNEGYNSNTYSNVEPLTDSANNERAGDQMISTNTAERTNPLETIELFPSAAETEAVLNELRLISPAGPRSRSRLFEMEDEPSLEQDYNAFTCVTSESVDDDNINNDRQTAGQNNSNLRTTVVHSYFQPQADVNSRILSDVEILAQDIPTNIESEQTKL